MHLRVGKRYNLSSSDPSMLLYSRRRPPCCQFSSPSWPCLIARQYSLLLSLFFCITQLIDLVLFTGLPLSFLFGQSPSETCFQNAKSKVVQAPLRRSSSIVSNCSQQRRPGVALSPRRTFFFSISRRRSLYVSGVHPFA